MENPCIIIAATRAVVLKIFVFWVEKVFSQMKAFGEPERATANMSP